MAHKHANYFCATDRGTSIHAFRFLCVFAETRHAWCTIMTIDVHRFSESLGSRLGPGQKALQAMNEFTLFVDFCLIPLSKTCAFDIPAKHL